MKAELIREYANDHNLDLGVAEPIVRRRDPLDTAAGAHIPAQGDVELFVDYKNELVYKVGTKDKLPEYLQDYKTLTVANKAGIAVPRPIVEPTVYDNYLVYASEYIDHDPYGSPTPEAAGELFAALHGIRVEAFRPAISKLGLLASFVMSECDITAQIQESIEERCLPCIEMVTQDMDNHESLLHGDVHLGNVLPTLPRPTLIDFEDSGRGSPLWDLAVLRQSATRFGLNAEWVKKCLSSWQQASGKEIDTETLDAYVDWRYWYGVLSMIKRTHLGEDITDELMTRLKWANNPADASKWKRR